MSLPASLIPESESRSSLFEKLPADLRRRLDQAIIDRDPASYRELHAKFDLAGHEVSFTALYRYARRLRAQADLLSLAELTLPDSPDLAAGVPTLFAYRLLDALNDETASPRELSRLVIAWRTAVNAHLALQRQDAQLAEDRKKQKSKETNDAYNDMNELIRLMRAQRLAQQRADAEALNAPQPTQPDL